MKPNDLAQLDRILAEWADWMSHEKVGRGYPSRVSIFSSGGPVTAALNIACA